jgi:tetratricopeptide (TPR) repeat protein
MQWLLALRMFLGTARLKYLASAIHDSSDHVLRRYLTAALTAIEGGVSCQDWPKLTASILPSLVEHLHPQNLEEAILRLLYLRVLEHLTLPPLDADEQVIRSSLDTAARIYAECSDLAERFYIIELKAYRDDKRARASEERGRFKEAVHFYEQAIAYYKSLATDSPIEWTSHLTDTLVAMANLLTNLGLFDWTEEVLRDALAWEDRIEHLDLPQDEEWWRRFATQQHNLGDTLREREQFFVAEKHLRLALRVRLRLCAISPDYRFSLARTLNNFGRCEREMAERGISGEGRRSKAIRYLRRALRMMSTTAHLSWVTNQDRGEEEPRHVSILNGDFRSINPPVAEVLGLVMQNLANTLGDQGSHFEALELLAQAKEVFRQLALSTHNPEYQRRFVASCSDHIAALLETNRLREAHSLLPELLIEARQLALKRPDLRYDLLAHGLSYASLVFHQIGEKYRMVTAAEEAIQLCEEEPTNFRLRGLVTGAYLVAAEYYAGVNGNSGFGYLAALRDRRGAVKQSRHLNASRSISLLQDLSLKNGREIVVIIAEQVGKESLLGLLSPSQGFSSFRVGQDLARKARELFQAQYAVAIPRLSIEADLRSRARDVFNAFPEQIRSVLTSSASCVFISGNAFWNAFPWELLLPSDDGRYLGLDQPLPRWGPIDHESLLGLMPKVRPLRSEKTVVACPLCHPRERDFMKDPQTASFLAEYDSVRRALANCGVRFESWQSILLGKNANLPRIMERIAEGPTLFHFIGHGTSADDGSLIVWDRLTDFEPLRLLNPGVLFEEKIRNRILQYFDEGGLVFLNCCGAGYERHFGGKGQDLCSKFIEEGADIVLSSYLPIVERVGVMMSKKFYNGLLVRGLDVGDALLEARRQLHQRFEKTKDRIYLNWSSVKATGNPFIKFSTSSEALQSS